MFWRMHGLAALIGFVPAFAATTPGLIRVTGVRSWSHSDSTRIIIETNGPFQYKTDKPPRDPSHVLVDILNARPLIGGRRSVVHPVGDRLVKRVRVTEVTPRITEIAFDLVASADLKISRLEAPDRMVIELRPLKKLPQTITRIGRPAFVYPPAPRRHQILMPAPPQIANPLFTDYATVLLPNSNRSLALISPPRISPSKPVRTVAKVLQPARPPVIDAAPLASENATRSLTRALGLKVNRIVIDAGHGGHDDGTIGPHGVLEKDVVLDVALRLSKLIEQRLGSEVVLTRSDDTFIPLHERTAIANQHKADLFISIHANSSPSPEVAGTETFFLNFTTSASALDVAARENAGADKTVGELKDLIQTITLNDKIEESHTLAQDIQTSLHAQASRTNPNAHDRGVKRAPFVVLIGASMPSILAEIGFVINTRDENNLNKPEYRQKIAEALFKGISRYSQSLSHFELTNQPGQKEKTVAGLEQ
jgi:N-acetylmuramoyl-L-alanine amidase